MALSFYEAKQRLLSGAPLTWEKFGDHKAGSVHLASAGARRLFRFLLSCEQDKVVDAHESLFDDLVAAWKLETSDPATETQPSGMAENAGPWRLARIETSGFGGLNQAGGPPFVVPFDEANWCLEGQNGSGKTSLASAIIWAMTGYRCRDEDGLHIETGVRTPVEDDAGSIIGDWPSIVSYPKSAMELAGTAETSVLLTFHDPAGNTAHAYRKLLAAPGAQPQIEVDISPDLMMAPELLEVGLLMPARLARIGFGERSRSIYDAVKLLTGLDQLAAIAEGAANFTHRSKRFLKYALDKGGDTIAARLEAALERASETAVTINFDLKVAGKREDKGYAQELRDIANRASNQAAEHLGVLTSEIASTLDTANAEDRVKIKSAVNSARAILGDSSKGVEVFAAWKALANAPEDKHFQTLPDLIDSSRVRLAEAVAWDKRQAEDKKLRLKALASSYFEPASHSHEEANCPLCEAKLTGEERAALADELAALKQAAIVAERRLADVCSELEKSIRDSMPQAVGAHFESLSTMQPRDAFSEAAKQVFVQGAPFSTVLTGIGTFASDASDNITSKLPVISYTIAQPDPTCPPAASALLSYLDKVERVLALAAWWQTHRPQFVESWRELVGRATEDGAYSADCLEGKVRALEAALERAAPLDQIATDLEAAAKEADMWLPINEQQRVRESIATALTPLKDLRLLVAAQTAGSISALADRMKQILARIHFRERLSFEDASLAKKAVHLTGSFDSGIRVDASVVANSSWLRAILWAFVLAVREQAIIDAGANPFPLMVLDDPQTTFDPRNKRKWAEEIARLGKAEPTDIMGAQILAITHERQFFQMLVNSEKLPGQQGLVVRLCDTSKVATIIYGDSLSSAFSDAQATNDDQKGHAYVQKVRIYLEDLLKIMLRAEDPDVANKSLDELATIMRARHTASVPPFTNPSFSKLLEYIAGGGGGKAMQYINEAHHHYDGTIGVAQAMDVSAFWEGKVESRLHTCFKIFAGFEAHVGEPRLFAWMENLVEFPTTDSADLKTVPFRHTGIAAAAKTDGRAGDGLITLVDLSEAQQITLYNHAAFQLTAGTLDPVADVGDVIIVSNYAKVNERNLVVATFQDQLLARRYNETELHPHIVILTGQATDPTSLPQPLIAPKEQIHVRKIVGTLFARHRLPVPPKTDNEEFVALTDIEPVQALLKDARLFQVAGRSAEPVALDGQYIITHPVTIASEVIAQLDGRLVIAVDDTGARYFKRFRPHDQLVVLESLNPDGMTPTELLSFDGEQGLPKLTALMEVVGILFELPS
ncbi:hypothetical protein BA950_04055 [Erythrobacter sp. SAORIC-644]|uniref:hypothetical protein n=1 Tax=Erythrobacter sp. SAORIC-644 TaxID=1869314 RepID=UPI000C9ED4CC|nr:hypothetical protein [Erythrobacter sp. SAORIC-644]PNQ77229.1 hypothetical protein BA950_04055 [Erythrobacter sp. SAORIC-644]